MIDYGQLSRRFLDAQLAGDRREAIRLLLEEGLQAGAPVHALYRGVIERAQTQVGCLWQENRISVAQEHLATAICQLALAQLYKHLPRKQHNGARVLVACVEGELHELGARMLADTLESEGCEVCFLGASTPPDALARMVKSFDAHLVCLSSSLVDHVEAAQRAVAAIRTKAGRGVKIAVGGSGFVDLAGREQELGVDLVGGEPEDLVRLALEAA